MVYKFFICLNKSALILQNGISNYSSLQKLFTEPQIHNLLRKLISCTPPLAIHEPKFRTENKQNLKLLSDKELNTINLFSDVVTSQKMQMPPVMDCRSNLSDEYKLIHRDNELCGILPSNQKIAFVDIGLESTRRQRLMVLREANGTLRHANESERDRLNQIFFPLPGRCIRPPNMFHNQLLDESLKNGRHIYILDRLLIQYEPDNPEYIRISHRVYDDIESRIWTTQCLDSSKINTSSKSELENSSASSIMSSLRNTRHYGPFALYVIAHLKRPESLIQDAMSFQLLNTADTLMHLTCLIMPDSLFASKLNINNEFPPCTINEPDPNSNQNVTCSKSNKQYNSILSKLHTFVNSVQITTEQRAQMELSLLQCKQSLEIVSNESKLQVA